MLRRGMLRAGLGGRWMCGIGLFDVQNLRRCAWRDWEKYPCWVSV